MLLLADCGAVLLFGLVFDLALVVGGCCEWFVFVFVVVAVVSVLDVVVEAVVAVVVMVVVVVACCCCCFVVAAVCCILFAFASLLVIGLFVCLDLFDS